MTDFLTTWASTPLAILKWVLLGLLLTNSRIWNHTRLAVALSSGLVFVGLGALFRITHWPFADALALGGATIVFVSYCLWFRTKLQRELLDYLIGLPHQKPYISHAFDIQKLWVEACFGPCVFSPEGG